MEAGIDRLTGRLWELREKELADIQLGSLAGGMTVEEICDQYRVTLQHIRAALAYAAEVVVEERVYALAGRRGITKGVSGLAHAARG